MTEIYPHHYLFFAVFSYGVGSLPFGLWIGRIFYGVDVREHGSKNPGATNVWRTLGSKPGVATLMLDVLKGLLPVLWARSYDVDILPIVAGLGAIIGHNWSLFLNLKGGKGVATSCGVFLGLLPKETGLAVLGFIIVFLLSKRVSVGSLAAAFVLFTSSFFFPTTNKEKILIAVAGLMVIVKHVPNIKRIASGTEPKVQFK